MFVYEPPKLLQIFAARVGERGGLRAEKIQGDLCATRQALISLCPHQLSVPARNSCWTAFIHCMTGTDSVFSPYEQSLSDAWTSPEGA